MICAISLRCAALTLVLVITKSLASPFMTAVPQKTFSMEDLIPIRPEFFPEKLIVEWTSDTEYLISDRKQGVVKVNAVNNSQEVILNEEDLNNISKHAMVGFSKDGSYLLLYTNRKKVYRYSSTAEYSAYNLIDKSLTKVEEGQLQAAVWGKGRSLAYAMNNNVYYVPDVSNPRRVIPLTTKGVPGEVYYGITDWIYEEEIFDAAEALWFSPNGSYLAVASFNDSNVDSAVYPCYGNPLDPTNQYPEMVEFKYPKSGRSNPVVGLQVFNVANPEGEPRVIQAPVDRVGIDHIIGEVNWASDHNLIVLWLNRRQNHSVLVNCDLKKDKCDMVQERTESNGWIDITEPLFDKSGTKMINLQPAYFGYIRYMHIVKLDLGNKLIEDLSFLNSTVTELLGWNDELATVYYLVSPSHMPWQRQVWSTTDGVSRCITCGEPSCHVASATFSPTSMFGVIVCSATNVPPKSFFYNAMNNSLELRNDNAKLSALLSEYKKPIPLFSVMPLAQDVVAHVRLMLPPDMTPGTKYPMVVKLYGGPGSTTVKDNFELNYGTYLASNKGFIVCELDVRGSGAMDLEAMHAINNAIGTLEVTDALSAIRKLVKLHTFIDEKRIGVWGWSYGGFTATMVLAQDNRHTVACAAAVAPVTSWVYYDSIYTERYMDTPARNALGYEQASLINHAAQLRGRRFLLVHGSGDDNVHYQNSLLLSKQLQHLDIAFEQMSYTDEGHSLFGVSRHLYHTLDRFWTDCFA